jgi:uncharacterized membrane protein
MISDPVALVAILTAVVFKMVWLERFERFRKLGAAAAAILFTMVLSNTGIIPGASPVYDFFTGYGVLAGTVMILLGVDLASIRAAGSTMLVAFGIGALGSTLGAMVMGFVLHSGLGAETWKLSGQFAATYIGGGVNFAAVAQAFDTSSDLFTGGVAADVIITAFWLVTTLAVPALMRSGPENGAGPPPRPVERTSDAPIPETRGPDEPASGDGPRHSLVQALFSSGSAVSLGDLAAILALTVGCLWIAELLGALVPAVPAVFWLTTLALLLAQLRVVRGLTGATVLGNYLILLFLACNGARSVVARIVEVGPEIFYFAAGTVAIHGLIVFGLGRLVRIDAGTLAVASQANVGGSASAMAIATARGYESRILPGVAVGILGVGLGNYVGLAVGSLMRVLLAAP